MATPPLKRLQGRPIRGEGDVGRERLVEAARTILRAQVPPQISRKAVADEAGVTPALVSYYFPDRDSLVAAATQPLIGQRIGQMLAIIESPDSRPEQLRQIVSLFVGLNETESHLIDYSIAFSRRDMVDPLQRSLLTAAYDRLRSFVRQGMEAGAWRPMDVDLFLFALWGMCKSVAQRDRRPGCNTADGEGDEDDLRVATVTDLALNGLLLR